MHSLIKLVQNYYGKHINDEIQDKNMTRYHKYGRWWYTTKKEAQDARRYNERVYFDEGMKAYYIIRPKKSIWDF